MIHDDMNERDYHAHPALSSTGVRRLLDSPARFHYWENHPQPPKAVFDVGTAAHTKILGLGAGTIVYPDEHLTASGNVSTKAATVEWAEEQRANGLIPISRVDARRVDVMAEAVLANTEARHILETISGREVSILTTIDGIDVKARFDLYSSTHAADLKTARDASPKGFNTSVGRYGYHIQERWYRDAHTAETGADLESFRFLVVESAAPYLVGVYDLDFMWEQIAQERVKTARDLYARCAAADEWPGYAPVTLTPPTWAIYESEDAEEITV